MIHEFGKWKVDLSKNIVQAIDNDLIYAGVIFDEGNWTYVRNYWEDRLKKSCWATEEDRSAFGEAMEFALFNSHLRKNDDRSKMVFHMALEDYYDDDDAIG